MFATSSGLDASFQWKIPNPAHDGCQGSGLHLSMGNLWTRGNSRAVLVFQVGISDTMTIDYSVQMALRLHGKDY
jgi:hypothetical protein